MKKSLISLSTTALLLGGLVGCAGANDNQLNTQNQGNSRMLGNNANENNNFNVNNNNDSRDGGKAGANRYFGTLDNNLNNLNRDDNENRYVIIEGNDDNRQRNTNNERNINRNDEGNTGNNNQNNSQARNNTANINNFKKGTIPFSFRNKNNIINDDGYGYFQDLNYQGKVEHNYNGRK